MGTAWLLQIGDDYIWSNDWTIAIDDGYYNIGISRSLTALTLGQYSGTSAIVVNAKTDTHTNACVQDNRTGLMWNKSPSASVGPASNGRLYWDNRVDQYAFSNNVGADFTAGKVITGAGTGKTALIRYADNTSGVLCIENPSGAFNPGVETISAPGGEGPADLDTVTAGNQEDIFEYCLQANAVSLSGYTDWRVPNLYELMTILLYNTTNGNAKPNLTYFTYAGTTQVVWSSTHAGSREYGAAAIRLDSGYSYCASTSSSKGIVTGYVYLVRGPDSTNYPCLCLRTGQEEMGINMLDDGYYRLGVEKSYTIMDQGDYSGNMDFYLWDLSHEVLPKKCILDNNTGLMWLHAISDNTYPLYDDTGRRGDAYEFLRAINLQAPGRHNDWRLPTIIETLSILECNTTMAIHPTVTDEPLTWSWIVTPYPPTPATYAFRYLNEVLWGMTDRLLSIYNVRLVRGGHTDDDL
jgi:hypothetical protein